MPCSLRRVLLLGEFDAAWVQTVFLQKAFYNQSEVSETLVFAGKDLFE